VSDPPACHWCGQAFTPRQGGSRQTFCQAACRAAYHKATRQWCEREIAEGRLSVESLRTAAYTLPGGAEASSSGPSHMEPPNSALLEPVVRFLVEVSLYRIEMLVRFGWLDEAQEDDLTAITDAMRRLGQALPLVSRIA
jgi:hypothetical protein